MTSKTKTPIKEWGERIVSTLTTLEQLRDRLTPPPALSDPAIELPALLAVWDKLRVNAAAHKPVDDAAAALASRLVNAKADVDDLTRFLLS